MNPRFKFFTLLLALSVLLPLTAKAQNVVPVDSQASLEAAINDGSNSKAELTKDITLTSTVTVPVEFTITSKQESTTTVKNLTISGNNNSSIFNMEVASGTISNLNLIKGKGTVDGNIVSGGAININVTTPPTGTASSTITLSGIAFENNISSITADGDVIAYGGAVYTNSTHEVVITGSSFKGNIASATSSNGAGADAFGGAIFNNGTGTVYVSSTTFTENAAGSGGAIFTNGKMQAENLSFTKNTATQNGGALYILGSFSGKNLTFTSNAAEGDGGAIVNKSTTKTILQNVVFDQNSAGGKGGAIYNDTQMSIAGANFNANKAVGEGGALFNINKLDLAGAINFNGNSSETHGGALYNEGSITATTLNFNNNTALGNGGAIYSSNAQGNGDLTLKGGALFTGNHSDGYGGAIYLNNSKFNLTSLNGIVFQGNTDSTGSNAINLSGTSVLNLNAGADINFYDKISGDTTATLRINASNALDSSIADIAPTSGRVNFYTGMEDFHGTFATYGGSLGLFADMTFNTNAFSLENTDIDMMNGIINNVTINNNYTQSGTANIKIDIDAKNEISDTINVPNGSIGGLNVADIKIISDSTKGATGPIVISNDLNVVFDTDKSYYGPIFQYLLTQPDQHSVILNKTDTFTPSILSTSLTQNSAVHNNTLISNSVMNRVGVMLSRDGRYYNTKNSYSLSKYDKFLNKKSVKTEDITQKEWYTTWFVPYGANQTFNFEDSMGEVKNKSYGGNVGIDFPVISLGNFGLIPTVFAGYGASSQKYQSLEASVDSGLFGIMATIYRENFFSALELHVTNGTEIATFDTYRDTFDLFTFSAVSKTEATIPLFSNLKLQPGIMFAYNLVNSQDYMTDLGAPINSDKLHNFQIVPGIKLMANVYGWHPYLNASYSYNAMNSSKVQVEEFVLPEFRTKSYFEYGIGLENTFLENYSGYFQLSGYAQGITGFSLQVGLRGYIN